jgi:hypothetical protein
LAIPTIEITNPTDPKAPPRNTEATPGERTILMLKMIVNTSPTAPMEMLPLFLGKGFSLMIVNLLRRNDPDQLPGRLHRL